MVRGAWCVVRGERDCEVMRARHHNYPLTPAKAGVQTSGMWKVQAGFEISAWVPAFAGMSEI